MNEAEVISLLAENKNDRGIAYWEKMSDTAGLKSFGIGLTQLRKLAKKVGRDRALSQKLWQNEYYDARVISLLIDDPKQVTREQAETQVEQLASGMLSHVFSSCDATLSKTSFADELAQQWLVSDSVERRRCAYGLAYELSKNKRNKALTDDYFLTFVNHIEKTFEQESPRTRGSMGGALMGIGKRNVVLNTAALKLAKALGPIDFNEGDSKCDPFDVVKHLESDYLKEKLGL